MEVLLKEIKEDMESTLMTQRSKISEAAALLPG